MKPQKAKGNAAEIERLRFQATNALLKLSALALTDLNALETLATELAFHIEQLNRDALQNLPFVRSLTRRCQKWPALVTVDKDKQSELRKIVQELELGQSASVNYQGRKQWSRATPEIRAALRVLQCCENHKLRLPPFNKATAREWWRAGRKYFVTLYGHDFENAPGFKHYRAKAQTTKDASLSNRTWIRKEILSKVARAMKTIAPPARKA